MSLISSTWNDDLHDYSPDGKRVAFVSNRSGSEEIRLANVHGSTPTQLTFSGGPLTANPHWSPDGQSIVSDSMAGSKGPSI